jgi:formylglycine-generating enzyme required for sulfatase activity
MVYVPGGTFMMGRNESDGGDDYESPAHSVTIKPFFIDIYEVTNEDYENFVKVTNHKVPQTWSNGAYPTGNARKPVTGVTWDDANDYARWVGKKLPTEEEWEFAARGEHGRLFPWGNKWLAYHANTGRNPEDSVDGSSLMANVGTYKDGKSEFGAYDMIGNAWEWTSSDFKMYSSGKLPEGVSPALEPKTIRGGCWATGNSQATTTLRRGYGARGEERGYSYAGFRLVQYVPDGTR